MRPAILTGIAMLLVAGYLAWFYTTHEREEYEIVTGYRGEARYNQFLAADRLLNELGIEAESRESFLPSEWLPPASDTIVMSLDPGIVTGTEFELLLNWIIGSGGHLVLLPPAERTQAADLFLSEFGLGIKELDAEALADIDVVDDTDEAGDGEDVDVDVAGDYMLAVGMADYRLTLNLDETVATVEDELGNIAVRVPAGNGFVTLFASRRLFNNPYLGEAQHAKLLLDGVAGFVDPGKVWLIFEAAYPSLWRVIWTAAPWLVLSLAAAFVFWLWAAIPRFGPKVDVPGEERRSLLEHLNAAGSFAWRNDGAESLGRSVVRSLLHEAERRHPGIGRLPPEKQAGVLAHLTGIDQQKVLDAMLAAGGERPRDFTDNVQLLQTIRKAL